MKPTMKKTLFASALVPAFLIAYRSSSHAAPPVSAAPYATTLSSDDMVASTRRVMLLRYNWVAIAPVTDPR